MPAERSEDGAGAIPTVLIVEDDLPVRNAICMLVRSCGWRSEAFESAEDFLDRFSRGPGPRCLLLDLSLGGLSGADLLEILAQLGASLPTVVVTAYEDHPLARRALQAGAAAIVAKPFRDDELMSAIQAALAPAASVGH